MDKTTKNVKTIAFGRRIRQIRNLEERLEILEMEMDDLANALDGVITDESGRPIDPFEKFWFEFKYDRMDALYDEINQIRDEIDEIEERVVEIHIRF